MISEIEWKRRIAALHGNAPDWEAKLRTLWEEAEERRREQSAAEFVNDRLRPRRLLLVYNQGFPIENDNGRYFLQRIDGDVILPDVDPVALARSLSKSPIQ